MKLKFKFNLFQEPATYSYSTVPSNIRKRRKKKEEKM